jgi:hypothetical protein
MGRKAVQLRAQKVTTERVQGEALSAASVFRQAVMACSQVSGAEGRLSFRR